MTAAETLRTVVTVAVQPATLAQLQELEPRLELLQPLHLLPPMQHPADFGAHPDFHRTPNEQAEFECLLSGADALLGVPDVEPSLLARTVRSAPGLRWVHTMAAGGGAQVQAAGLTRPELDRVLFTTSAGVHAAPLAEFAILGLLAGLKSLPDLDRDSVTRVWRTNRLMGQLAESTIVVLGAGGIGKAVIERLAPFGVRIIATSRQAQAVPGAHETIHPDRLTEALARADGLVVTLPGTDRTAGMVGDAAFAAARRGLTVVNVGRGTVIDERALVTALDDGTVRYAALDVFEAEPLDRGSTLWGRPNVLISPHTAARSPLETARIIELFADNARRLLDGAPLRNVVNTHEFY